MTAKPKADSAARPKLRLLDETPTFFPPARTGSRPEPETRARRNLIHGATALTLVLSFAYLTWRLLDTINLDVWWVAIPLFAAEAHNTFGLVLYSIALWDIDVLPKWHAVRKAKQSVAVLIPTYNEPEDILIPVIAAALAMKLPHETWVLDDGRRPNIERLAREMGASYLTREDNKHAKAGNLNHAIAIIQADIYAILDADHVARPEFLTHTLCYFEDPDVAVVQTPQDFYNQDSFEHHPQGRDIFYEEAVFYRVIAPGKNKWGGAFWCGTGALVRATALESVGGVATGTVTEDIHTTMKMNRLGWKAVYHNEVLARGLAPTDALQYMLQRNRWAIGAMQVLRQENPFFRRGLTFGQRLSFATTLLAWFDSWRTLTFVLLPAAVIFSGVSPIDAPGYVYAPFFLAAFVSQFVTLRMLARGHYPPVLSLVFEMLRMPAVLPATLEIFNPGQPRRFKVTPKGRADARHRVEPPVLLVGLFTICALAIVWFTATLAHLTPTSYEGTLPAVVGSLLFAAANFWLISIAIQRIRASEFSGERRSSTRFDVFMHCKLDEEPSVVRNISLTGARVETKGSFRPRQEVALDLGKVTLQAEVVRSQAGHEHNETTMRFLPNQTRAIGDLVLTLIENARPQTAGPSGRSSAHRTSPAAAA